MSNAFTRLFFVEESKTSTPCEQKKQEESIPSKVQIPNINIKEESAYKGEINENILKIISNAIEQSSGDASDYHRLKVSVEGMEKAGISNEKDRYIAAYIALKAMSSINKESIIKSIDACIDIVMNEKNNAINALSIKRKDKIDKKEETLKEKQNIINSLNYELENIKAKIAEETQSIAQIQNEINESEKECNKNEADLDKTIEMILSQLQEDKEKLNIILKD